MVKHAARRHLQGMHKFLLSREEADDKKKERNAKKREEKAKQMAIDSAGEGGQVKGLKDVKFSGQFGVNFTAGSGTGKSMADDDEDEDRMDGEMDGDVPVIFCKSQRKQNGLAISKMNHLIAKQGKKERKMDKERNKVTYKKFADKGGKRDVKKKTNKAKTNKAKPNKAKPRKK